MYETINLDLHLLSHDEQKNIALVTQTVTAQTECAMQHWVFFFFCWQESVVVVVVEKAAATTAVIQSGPVKRLIR